MLTFTTPSGKTGDPSVLMRAHPAGDLEMRRENIRKNIARGLPQLELNPALRGSDVMKLVCFGPSLSDTWESVTDGEGDIWTVSGANTYLYKRGVNARYHLEADPREHKTKLLIGSCPLTQYLIASRCPPAMFDFLADRDVSIYHVWTEEENDVITQAQPKAWFVMPAWTMGNTALHMGIARGYKKFRIWGMDGSFAQDGRQHAADHPREEPVALEYKVDGRAFMAHPGAVVATECFIKLMVNYPYGTFEFVGDGMIPHAYKCYTKDYR